MNFDNQIQNIQKYGYRRMTKALKELGFTVNHKKVLRIMTEHAWFCQAFNRQKENIIHIKKSLEEWLKII
ncbi:IS3 family transposase [Companilactobacillus paralimentarius]|nr:IS3 family transposase [Companilactobacillus paralimentarius]